MSDAGWYADPSDAEQVRYWDGTSWSDDVRPQSSEPTSRATPAEPPAAPPLVTPAPLAEPPTLGTPAPAAEPPTLGTPAAPWSAGVPVPPRTAPQPKRRSRGSRGRGVLIALFAVVALGIIGGASFGVWKLAQPKGGFERPGAIESSGDDDGTAPAADVIQALERFGVRCTADSTTPQSHAEFVATVGDIGASVSGRSTAVGDAAADFLAVAEGLDPDDTYSMTVCGSSRLVVVGDIAVYGYFAGAVPPAVEEVSGLGLRLVSVAPPSIADTVELIEGRDETCPLPGRTTTKEVLMAELFPLLVPSDGSAPPAAVVAEKAAVDALPEQKIEVRSCTNTTVFGTGSWALVVRLTADSTVPVDGLGAVTVVGP